VRRVRLVLSDAAVADILEQGDWYVAQSGQALAKRWEKAVAEAIRRLLNRAHSGTPCRFQSPELWGVRRTTISGFPKHLLFYRLHEGEILILRVVHGARDLERLL